MSTWCDVIAENSIIGGIISVAECKKYVPQLTEDDFTTETNRKLFKTIASLYDDGQPIDIVTVSAKIPGMLYEIAERTKDPSWSAVISRHIEVLKKFTARRKIAQIASNIAREAKDVESDAIELCDKAVREFREIMPQAECDESLGSVLAETYSEIADRKEGRNLGVFVNLTDFDGRTGGLFPAELTVIGARPGVGKSALAQHISMAFAKKGLTVEFISREMSRAQYGTRLLAAESGVSGSKIRRGDIHDDEIAAIVKSLPPLSRLPIFINTTARNMPEILAACHERQQKDGLGLVVVDYLQLLHGKGNNREQEVSAVSRGLKELALEFNIPVLALSQLNRETGNNAPTLTNLRESGAIEQDADNVILIHDMGKGDENGKQLRLIIAKQRQGNTGYVDVMFVPEKMRFTGVYNG